MAGNEFTAKTVEEAVEEGLKSLELKREEAEITVLEQGGTGFLRKTKAKVRITKRLSDGLRALKFTEELLERMGLNAAAEVAEEEEKITINLISTSSSALIGYRGEVLDALQCLAGAIANIGREDYRRVVVDCESYRQKREDTLIGLAKKTADRAVRMGRKMSLEPMNPYERRIIHSALSSNEEVKTLSEGREPNRYIVVMPNVLKPFSGERGSNRDQGRRDGFNRDRRDDRRGGERGFNRDRDRRSGPPKKKSTIADFTAVGGYLGNSLKEDK